ncbi:MAG: glycosyltransferase family 2 protein [Gammaproteobacteria bacterium]
MSTISVIIATFNRPVLLTEAVESVLQQSRAVHETIIVDDGSIPPVDVEGLTKRFGTKLRVIRNREPQGLAWARNQGVESARGDYIVHLDDDDLYAPQLVEHCAAVLDEDPRTQLVFIGVEGFGSRAEHFNRAHRAGLEKVVEQARGRISEGASYRFDDSLLHGLLNQVPMSFQRVMTRRQVWHDVTRLRYTSYGLAFGLASEEQAKQMIRGTLRDSEWALYAALSCRRTALIQEPLYRQRCEGQGTSSQLAMRHTHRSQALMIKSVLDKLVRSDAQFRALRKPVRASLSNAYFNAAYECMTEGLYRSSLGYLWRTACLGPRLRHAKLFARLAGGYLGG